jgi:hypothetical protein
MRSSKWRHPSIKRRAKCRSKSFWESSHNSKTIRITTQNLENKESIDKMDFKNKTRQIRVSTTVKASSTSLWTAISLKDMVAHRWTRKELPQKPRANMLRTTSSNLKWDPSRFKISRKPALSKAKPFWIVSCSLLPKTPCPTKTLLRQFNNFLYNGTTAFNTHFTRKSRETWEVVIYLKTFYPRILTSIFWMSPVKLSNNYTPSSFPKSRKHACKTTLISLEPLPSLQVLIKTASKRSNSDRLCRVS